MAWREVTVTTEAGRVVHALVIGDPSCGRVVVYHHGFPATRLEALIARNAATELGVCVVAIDRPGVGGSDWYQGRTLADWPSDVLLVMQSLGVSKFYILAVSGGTPSAVVLASAVPERVLGLTVVSGIAPICLEGALLGTNFVNRGILKLGVRYPKISSAIIRGIAHVWRRFPSTIALWFGVLLPRVDREVVSKPIIAGALTRSITDAFRSGVNGVVTEFELLLSDWSPELEKVSVPTSIWHGSSDTYVPFAMGRILHERARASSFREISGAGHFMVIPLIREVMADVVSRTWSESDTGAA